MTSGLGFCWQICSEVESLFVSKQQDKAIYFAIKQLAVQCLYLCGRLLERL